MLKVNGGRSQKDRITFCTNESTATAIRCKDGTVDIKFAKQDVDMMKAIIAILAIFGTLSLIKAYIIIPLIINGIAIKVLYFIVCPQSLHIMNVEYPLLFKNKIV